MNKVLKFIVSLAFVMMIGTFVFAAGNTEVTYDLEGKAFVFINEYDVKTEIYFLENNKAIVILDSNDYALVNYVYSNKYGKGLFYLDDDPTDCFLITYDAKTGKIEIEMDGEKISGKPIKAK